MIPGYPLTYQISNSDAHNLPVPTPYPYLVGIREHTLIIPNH